MSVTWSLKSKDPCIGCNYFHGCWMRKRLLNILNRPDVLAKCPCTVCLVKVICLSSCEKRVDWRIANKYVRDDSEK